MNLDFTVAEKILAGEKEPEKKEIHEDIQTGEIVDQTPFDNEYLVSLDVERAKLTFSDIQNQMSELKKKATDIKITDKDTHETAQQMLIQCRVLLKSVDENRLNMPAYKKASEFKSAVDKFLRENIKNIITNIQNKILPPKISEFHKAEAELERRIQAKKAAEEEERLRKEREKEAEARREKQEKDKADAETRQKQLDEIAKKEGVEGVQIIIPEVQTKEQIEAELPIDQQPVFETEEDKKSVTDYGTAKIEPEWVLKEIVNPDKVPRGYCSPDERKIKEAIKSGVRIIEGCIIEQEYKSKIRVKSR